MCVELVGSPRAGLCWAPLREPGPTKIICLEAGTDQQDHLTEKCFFSTSSAMPGQSEEQIPNPSLQFTFFPPRNMLTPCRRSEGSLNRSWVPYVRYSCFHLLNYHEDTANLYKTSDIYFMLWLYGSQFIQIGFMSHIQWIKLFLKWDVFFTILSVLSKKGNFSFNQNLL